MAESKHENGIIMKTVRTFLGGYFSIILIVLAGVLGLGSILLTPREEEPQIVVPLADVYVFYPGASAKEVEYLVATPLEELLWQIDGVEYVYSTSRRDMAIVTVRFFVGEDRERSLVKLYNKLQSNLDQEASGITGWVVKPIEIDDVSIVNLTLYSKKSDDYALRRVGEEMLARLEKLPDISRTDIVGGLKREVRVELDPAKMAAMHLSPLEIYQALSRQNASLTAGQYDRNDERVTVYSGPFIKSLEDIRKLVVGIHNGKPVYLAETAQVIDGPQECESFVRLGFGASGRLQGDGRFSAVTLTIAKKKGTNAVQVAKNVIEEVKRLKQEFLPSDMDVIVTRNYGKTADQKVNDLLSSLLFAIVTVVLLLALTMGWREAVVVSAAVPISFALALSVNYLAGFTINRVTLFALILSLGLVVDDPITNVDNIQRHILKGRHKNALIATLAGVREVIAPVIMSTLAIIISFTPMFFITGMMGPYMRPMAINVPLTVTFSTVCALTIVPWLSYHLLKHMHQPDKGLEEEKKSKDTWIMRLYHRIARPFLASRSMAFGLLATVVLLLGVAGFLALSRKVPLKMLPYDNKNEFQIVINMPEGSTLERTDAVVRDYEDYLRRVKEVTNFVSYVGVNSPMDFNGMVRHYYLRRAHHLADIRVNILDKDQRVQQSHALVLRLRKDLEAIAVRHNADVELVEVPPGPPVIATVVAEITGDPDKKYAELIKVAKRVKKRMGIEPGMVDRDWTVEAPYTRMQFSVDKVKASLHKIDTETIVRTLRLALTGAIPGHVHVSSERNPLEIRMVLPRVKRSWERDLENIYVKGETGRMVPLAEIGTFKRQKSEQPIYHKNLVPIVYVMSEMAGRPPAEAIIDLKSYFRKNPLPNGIKINWAGEGEWLITLDVFRDLGIAFGVAMIGIYLLLIIETSSLLMPIVVMMAIPLTAIGIMPGFYLLNLINSQQVGGFSDLVFFTATGMIGMIALGGIVVRNSIVLIEFIENARKEGVPLEQAILDSGGTRFRPIMLTAATTALGVWPITLDPIFSGLAWSLIFGLFASTMFTLLVVPVVYYLLYRGKKNDKGHLSVVP